MKEGYMRCEVFPGMFTSEYSVVIYMGGNEYAYSWADNSNVIVTSGEVNLEDPNSEAAEGWARVIVMEERPDGMLVTLPYATQNQRTFLVNPKMVEYQPE